jgi:hypothetical protein
MIPRFILCGELRAIFPTFSKAEGGYMVAVLLLR